MTKAITMAFRIMVYSEYGRIGVLSRMVDCCSGFRVTVYMVERGDWSTWSSEYLVLYKVYSSTVGPPQTTTLNKMRLMGLLPNIGTTANILR